MRNRTSLFRRALAVLTAVGVLASAVACGGDDDSGHGDDHDAATAAQTAPNGDVFNGADMQFATDMIPHHAQAVQMAVLAQGRPLDPEVEQLSNQIRDAQVPEIETMTDWLMAWGEEVPETPLDHANAGHDMDDMERGTGGVEGMDDMPGMMSQDDMDALANAPDAEFQTMWIEMMIEHHQGAIEMAQDEQDDGEFTGAIDLAKTIETTQNEEIATMEGLLG